MRLFLGIDLPAEIKVRVYEYLRPIHQSPKGWENAHDYHQTLLFIGESSEDDLKTIISKMEAFSFKSFFLQPRGFEFFNRRVMYLSFDHSPELLEMKERVEALFPEWLRPNAKPFIPHVTVKRWQRYEFDHIRRGLDQKMFSLPEFQVSSLDLFKSEKDSHNNKYHVIHRVNF